MPPPRRRAACLVLLLAAAALGGACGGPHRFGQTCSLGPGASGASPADVTINAPALECDSRICVLPGASAAANTGPLCTATCASDDDCAGGERASAATDPRCKSGFACRVAMPVGSFGCRKLCLCRDFPLLEETHSAASAACP